LDSRARNRKICLHIPDVILLDGSYLRRPCRDQEILTLLLNNAWAFPNKTQEPIELKFAQDRKQFSQVAAQSYGCLALV
jgi:hypothetical protein